MPACRGHPKAITSATVTSVVGSFLLIFGTVLIVYNDDPLETCQAIRTLSSPDGCGSPVPKKLNIANIYRVPHIYP